MRILFALPLAALLLSPLSAHAIDEKAAEGLMKDNNCTKCHSVSKKKEGPSYKEVSEKYKGKPDGESKVMTHLTTTPTVKVDGKDEKHDAIKGSPDEIKNLVQWILSR